MKIIKPSFEILTEINGDKILKNIESIGRTCYRSEDLITKDSAKKFVANLIKRKHLAVIEHENITVKFICDRGVSHEVVRHRIASYAQESQRYVNYNKEKFGSEITYIKPCFWNEFDEKFLIWLDVMNFIEEKYKQLIELGAKPEEARSILPNSTKTELVVTMNLRSWLHFLELRTAKEAHPQMREITIPLLKELQNKIPVIFDDIGGMI